MPSVMLESPRIGAVIPTYCPAPEELGRLCQILVEQVDHVLIVDNSEDSPLWLSQCGSEKVSVLVLGGNKGIGCAQNKGLEWLEQKGYAFALLLDQDSVPLPRMVTTLVTAWQRLTEDGARLAAVGPASCSGENTQSEPLYISKKNGVHAQVYHREHPPVEVAYLHASGTLVAIEVMRQVGWFRQELFIDLIDVEWCYRARQKGYASYGVPEALLQHQVGKAVHPLGFKRLPSISVHPPVRGYYQLRNVIILLQESTLPRKLLLSYLIRRVVLRILVQLVFASNRKERLSCFFQGLKDGLKGVTGPCDTENKRGGTQR